MKTVCEFVCDECGAEGKVTIQMPKGAGYFVQYCPNCGSELEQEWGTDDELEGEHDQMNLFDNDE
jgi:transcription elongation factor Elf1